MKRFRVHLQVGDLGKSIGSRSKVLPVEPTRIEADFAK